MYLWENNEPEPEIDIMHGYTWWRHQMETFSTKLALCEGNPPVTGGIPSQMPVTRSFEVFLIYVWRNGSVNNWDAGDLRRHRAQFDVIVMSQSQGTAAAHAPWNAIIISVHFSLYPETFNLKIPTKVFPQYVDFIRSIVRVGSVCIYLFRDPVCFQFTCLAALDPIRLKEGRTFPYHIMCYSEVCRLQNNLHFELYRRYPEGGGGGGGVVLTEIIAN